jgi:hypothetical protein
VASSIAWLVINIPGFKVKYLNNLCCGQKGKIPAALKGKTVMLVKKRREKRSRKPDKLYQKRTKTRREAGRDRQKSRARVCLPKLGTDGRVDVGEGNSRVGGRLGYGIIYRINPFYSRV